MFTDFDNEPTFRTRISASGEVELLTVDGDNQITARPVEFVAIDELEIPDVR